MSYKNRILNDFPNSFYLLDGAPTEIYDYSGSLNNGTVTSPSSKQIMPLVTGSVRGTEVLSSTTITYDP